MTGASPGAAAVRPRGLLRHRFIRFLLVGTVNTGFSYLVYAIFLFIGLHFALANLLALIFGILFSFHTQGHLVFDNTDRRLLGRFVLAWVVIYLANLCIIAGFVALGCGAYLAGALTLPFSTGLSYVVLKRFVFRTGPGPRRVDAALPVE
jgi:putative flippase GtrA